MALGVYFCGWVVFVEGFFVLGGVCYVLDGEVAQIRTIFVLM